MFPKKTQGTDGVFTDLQHALEITNKDKTSRYFTKENEDLKISDAEIAVSSQWGIGNIGIF